MTVRSTPNSSSGRGRFRRSSSVTRAVKVWNCAVLAQQRDADAIARHHPRDAPRQGLERERDVRRARDDVEHVVLRLELLDLIERQAMRAPDGRRGGS